MSSLEDVISEIKKEESVSDQVALDTDPCLSDWEEDGRRLVHWYDPKEKTWWSQDTDSEWKGFDGEGHPVAKNATWEPWTSTLNDDHAPFVHWYEGGLTNIAFNEIDRWILASEDSAIEDHVTGALFESKDFSTVTSNEVS